MLARHRLELFILREEAGVKMLCMWEERKIEQQRLDSGEHDNQKLFKLKSTSFTLGGKQYQAVARNKNTENQKCFENSPKGAL